MQITQHFLSSRLRWSIGRSSSLNHCLLFRFEFINKITRFLNAKRNSMGFLGRARSLAPLRISKRMRITPAVKRSRLKRSTWPSFPIGNFRNECNRFEKSGSVSIRFDANASAKRYRFGGWLEFSSKQQSSHWPSRPLKIRMRKWKMNFAQLQSSLIWLMLNSQSIDHIPACDTKSTVQIDAETE